MELFDCAPPPPPDWIRKGMDKDPWILAWIMCTWSYKYYNIQDYIVSQGGGRLLANMVMVKGTVSRECYGVLSYEALLSA